MPAEMDISEMETQPFFAAIATLPALPRVECSAEMDLNEMETQPMFPVSPAHFLSFYLAFFLLLWLLLAHKREQHKSPVYPKFKFYE